MSQSAQIILGAPNPFTVNPSMTYFKSNYEPQDSPLGESFEIPFDNQQIRFGTTSECTIPLYGDLLTSTFLRVTLPAIYPPQTGTYVYPNTSTSFSGALYVQFPIVQAIADGSNLTVSVSSSHFFSVGARVILSGTQNGIFNLDGTYTISSIPTANSFACSTTLAGISYTGKVASVGIQPSPTVGYYSTQNLDLWTNKVVNLPYFTVGTTITAPNASLVPGQKIQLVEPTQGEYTVATSSGNTFTLVGGTSFDSYPIVASLNRSPGMAISNDAGSTWLPANPPVSPGSYSSFAYVNGLFVTVNKYGPPYVLTSPDGITWTTQTAPSGYWSSVTYGNGLFVAVNDYGSPYVMTSPDGINWTGQTAPSGSWTSITYGNGLFVAVGYYSSPYVMTSPDGINWTAQTAPSGLWRSVTYGNGLFVAAEPYGPPIRLMTSPDGINWTVRTAPSMYSGAVTYGGGYFVAV